MKTIIRSGLLALLLAAGTALADPAVGPPYQAYLGAAQAMQGRDAWMPRNKLTAADKGLATLDKALRRVGPRRDRDILGGSPIEFPILHFTLPRSHRCASTI
jgi:hypothetical protein